MRVWRWTSETEHQDSRQRHYSVAGSIPAAYTTGQLFIARICRHSANPRKQTFTTDL